MRHDQRDYGLPRKRRPRHRDKFELSIVLLAVFVCLQFLTADGKTGVSTSTTAKPPVEHLKTTSLPATTPRTHTDSGGNDRSSLRNCTKPAIEQFPRPLIGPTARAHGAIIFNIILAVYSFIAIAIVCDDYFVSSLDKICEEMRLSPDVAGATFMAAGSSAPELATVIIGVFFAHDDIGVSGVIGSAVFNIMFVVSICALCTSTVCYLNWWPLCRDCFFYAISILLMLCAIYDEKVTWFESLIMLFMYIVYCVCLYFNPRLERWAQTLPVPCKKPTTDQEGPVTYKNLDEGNLDRHVDTSPTLQSPEKLDFGGAGTEGYQSGMPSSSQAPQQNYYRSRETDPNQVSPLIKPTDGNTWTLAKWYITVPIHYLCLFTLPDCKSEKYKNWYPLTFAISMLWISFFSYIMVWMITICGNTFGIPDTVMGLTFVAAGVSVPDALSSLAVVKEGYGDMAVSNAVGSNVFDILICLGVPWFVQTAIYKPGSHVNVISKGLVYSTLSLLSTVVFLIVATHLNGWKLDKKYGVILMLWYLFFITFASLYELNVFGYMNPRECVSEY